MMKRVIGSLAVTWVFSVILLSLINWFSGNYLLDGWQWMAGVTTVGVVGGLLVNRYWYPAG